MCRHPPIDACTKRRVPRDNVRDTGIFISIFIISRVVTRNTGIFVISRVVTRDTGIFVISRVVTRDTGIFVISRVETRRHGASSSTSHCGPFKREKVDDAAEFCVCTAFS